jgi:hypothetical protein
MKITKRPAAKQKCWACEALVSTSGFAATSHAQSAAHIAGLVSKGQFDEAADLQMRADVAAHNRRASRAQVAARG